jgi:hypothetical protein
MARVTLSSVSSLKPRSTLAARSWSIDSRTVAIVRSTVGGLAVASMVWVP